MSRLLHASRTGGAWHKVLPQLASTAGSSKVKFSDTTCPTVDLYRHAAFCITSLYPTAPPVPTARTVTSRAMSSAGSTESEAVNCSADGPIATITLSRPKTLNALNLQVLHDVVAAAQKLDKDESIRAIIITGAGPKAFAAGADIKQMAPKQYAEVHRERFLEGWDALQQISKPLIAAVNGYALGGGCELAMMCDIILASENAVFGQPEVTLGVIPGMGGTQRLVRAVGKSKAMEMVLTGAKISAAEAVQLGLISRAVPQESLLNEARKLATAIAGMSAPVVAKAKDCVNRAYETSLTEGLRYEKREFWSCFALHDQKEGMSAFVEKRPADFKHS